MMNYGKVNNKRNSYGYCFDLYEMTNEKWKTRLLYSKQAIKEGRESIDEEIRKIFYNMFKQIIKDVLLTGNMFVGRFGSFLIQIYMKKITGEELKKMIRKGYFKRANFALIGHEAYYPYINVQSSSRRIADVIINMDNTYDEMLDDLLNDGMIYEHKVQEGLQHN